MASKEVFHIANKKETSRRVAKEASSVLRNKKEKKINKSVAGSALTQAKNNNKHRKGVK